MSYEENFLIWIDPDHLWDVHGADSRPSAANAYEQSVRQVITGIGQSQVGGVLLRSIKYHGKLVRIKPVQDMGASDSQPGEAKDFVINKHIGPFMRSLLQREFRAIRAVVGFSPHLCAQGGSCHRTFAAANDFTPTPESVLLHELVHALRYVSNKYSGTLPLMGAGWNHGEREEFFAVLVENIYRSEVNDRFRASHKGWKNLEEELQGSFAFFKVSTHAFSAVESFCKDNPGFTKAIAKLRISFNPIAAYYCDPRKARQFSNSTTAVRRDLGPLQLLIPFVRLETLRRLL